MRTKGDAVSDVLKFLANIPLFSSLSEPSCLLLAHASWSRQIGKGEILFLQHDSPESAFIVRSGEVSIILNSSDGREMVINEMHSGDLFGELGLLTKRPRSTSAIARTKCDLLVIPGQAFVQVVGNEPQFALQMLEMTAKRLQMSGTRESALAFLDAQARLARLLLELEGQEKDQEGYVAISQDELAHHTGLIRQTVAKVLGKWRRAGWLITRRGRIRILNRIALEELESNLLI